MTIFDQSTIRQNFRAPPFVRVPIFRFQGCDTKLLQNEAIFISTCSKIEIKTSRAIIIVYDCSRTRRNTFQLKWLQFFMDKVCLPNEALLKVTIELNQCK